MNGSFYKFVSSIFNVPTTLRITGILEDAVIEAVVREIGTLIPREKTNRHFRSEHFVGDWSGIALYSADGKSGTMRRALGTGYKPTEKLNDLPQTAQMLNTLKMFGDLQRVRILKVSPGTHVKYHIDLGETVRFGVARLHIPIITNGDCKIVLNGKQHTWAEGELWYGDFSQPHELWNAGKTDRYHLVIDIKLNDQGFNIFPTDFIKPNFWQKFGIFINQFTCVAKNRELKGFLINKIRGI